MIDGIERDRIEMSYFFSSNITEYFVLFFFL